MNREQIVKTSNKDCKVSETFVCVLFFPSSVFPSSTIHLRPPSRQVNVHTGRLGSTTDWTRVNRRPTQRTQAEVPAREQQHTRFLPPAATAPPPVTAGPRLRPDIVRRAGDGPSVVSGTATVAAGFSVVR